MQKSSQPQLAAGPLSGQVAPTVVGPDKDRTELYLALGVLAILGLGMSAYWLSSRSSESEPPRITTGTSNLSFGGPVQPAKAEAKPLPVATVPIITKPEPITAVDENVKHLDVYFEVGRNGLTDEAKAQLKFHAEIIKKDANWGVVLQGYTDQQGSADYNRKLGLRRAESVKDHLVDLGVPEHVIKVVSLGKDGSLCVDSSDQCSRMNRRVHLEFRNVGAEHLALPPAIANHPSGESVLESNMTPSPPSAPEQSAAADTTVNANQPSSSETTTAEK